MSKCKYKTTILSAKLLKLRKFTLLHCWAAATSDNAIDCLAEMCGLWLDHAQVLKCGMLCQAFKQMGLPSSNNILHQCVCLNGQQKQGF